MGNSCQHNAKTMDGSFIFTIRDGAILYRTRGSKDDDAPLGETREEAQARELRHDPTTYTAEPEDPTYGTWKNSFDLDDRVTEVSTLLSTDGTLRRLHAKLVPRKVSYNQFWARYFFAMHLLKMQGQKRQALLDRIGRDDDSAADQDDGFADWGGCCRLASGGLCCHVCMYQPILQSYPTAIFVGVDVGAA
eukprot:m.1170115 g.1170115  ORF g.1170115 m.1170115 type:complete len:191 (-) comp24510_c0_seq11:6002-6574(-)